MRVKKIVILSILLICVVAALVTALYFSNKKVLSDDGGILVIIPAKSVEGITEKEAEMLCYEKIGKVSPENGFSLIYIPVASGEYHKEQYYIFRWKWLVNNHHYSTIGYIAVNSDGKEIRDAVEHSNGDFELGDVKWKM